MTKNKINKTVEYNKLRKVGVANGMTDMDAAAAAMEMVLSDMAITTLKYAKRNTCVVSKAIVLGSRQHKRRPVGVGGAAL